MAAIDIGSGAVVRASWQGGDRTYIDLNNPANASGKITSVSFYYSNNGNGTDVRIGVFYGSGTSYTCRSFAVIGTVAQGSKQDFPVSLQVVAGDFLGFYQSGGFIYTDSSGGIDIMWKAGDQTEAGTQTYASAGATYRHATEGSGMTLTPGGGMAGKLVMGRLI